MVLKRSLVEDGSDNSHASTHNQNTGHKFRKIIEHVKQEDFIQEIVAKVVPIFRSVVRQELEEALRPLESSQRCFFMNQPKSSSSRTLQLTFVNKPRSTFFTNSKIVAEGHCTVTIQLIDANSREVISDAPFGSMEVMIFAIDGDFTADGQENWSNKALNDGILREREGRRPLLVGELSFSLTHGIGYIKDVIFTDNSSWLRSRKFRLGVRAVPNTSNGVRIKEGISEAFVVLEHRGESYQKHDIPFLNDPLWRLSRISKNGAIYTKLAEKGIHTVKDFLRLYHTNPKFLRQIVGNGVPNKTWESIVKHANKCCLDNTLYTYYHVAAEIGLLLNSVYKVLGVTFCGINYQSVDSLNNQHKALVERLQHQIYRNPSVLCPTDASSNYPIISSQFQINEPICVPSFDPWDNCPQITEQGNMLDVTYYDPSSLNLEEDIPSYRSQPFEHTLCGSSSESINQEYGWNPLIMDKNFDPQTSNFDPQTSNFDPVVTTWATTSGSSEQFSAGGKSKACWVKIRALLMWKIVKRDAAAKKKGKLQLGYYETQFA